MRPDPWIDDLNARFPRRQPEPPYRHNIWADIIMLLVLGLICGLIATKCSGQTISPVISEAKGPKVKGEITLTNGQLIPMAVVIEPQSMSVATSGTPLYRHLDPGIDVKLDTTSARLGPKQTFTVGYTITCPNQCVVNLSAAFMGLHTKDGLAIALRIGNVLYICPDKAKGCRDRTRAGWGLK